MNRTKSGCKYLVHRKVVDKKKFELFTQQPLHDIESDGRILSSPTKDPPGQGSSYILPGECLNKLNLSELAL